MEFLVTEWIGQASWWWWGGEKTHKNTEMPIEGVGPSKWAPPPTVSSSALQSVIFRTKDGLINK